MKLSKLFMVLGASLALSFTSQAQTVVPDAGVGPLTFDATPPATEWATFSITGAAGTLNTDADVDAAVAPLTQAGITAALGTSATEPPGTLATFRRHTARNSLFSRPTGNNASVLKASLQNGSANAKSGVRVSYDLDQTNPITEQIPGHRVYWSLDGSANSWQAVGNFSTVGPITFDVNVGSWPSSGALYLLWVDDNANPGTDGASLIDNVVFEPFGDGTPVVIAITGPTNQTALQGQNAEFAVMASGEAPLRYQWRKETNALALATNATLTLPNVIPADAGHYDVVVSNARGSATSAVAVLTVIIPVAITVPPTLQAVSAGATAMFQVSATGFPAPNYQWLFRGEALPSANGSSLVLTNVGTNVLGEYAVAVWNAYSATTSAPVQLVMLPSLRNPFAGATVTWGKMATLSLSVWGSGPLTYQWFKDGMILPGATNAVTEFAAVQIADGGLYSVVVSNPYGTVTNAPAQLVVNPANIALGMYAGVTIEGVPGYTYCIQHTTDLRDTNSWVTATNLTLTETVELWVDRAVNVHSATNARRYYRIIGQ